MSVSASSAPQSMSDIRLPKKIKCLLCAVYFEQSCTFLSFACRVARRMPGILRVRRDRCVEVDVTRDVMRYVCLLLHTKFCATHDTSNGSNPWEESPFKTHSQTCRKSQNLHNLKIIFLKIATFFYSEKI